MASRPTSVPTFATSGAHTAPASGLIASGWSIAVKPAAAVFNWWWNLVGSWVDYYAESVDVDYSWNVRSIPDATGVTATTETYSGPYTLIGYKPTATSVAGTLLIPLARLLPAEANRGTIVIKSVDVLCDLAAGTDEGVVRVVREIKDGSAGRAEVVNDDFNGTVSGLAVRTATLNHTVDDDYTYLLSIEPLTASGTTADCTFFNVTLTLTRPRVG